MRVEEPPGPGGLRRCEQQGWRTPGRGVLASREGAFKHWRQMCGILGALK